MKQEMPLLPKLWNVPEAISSRLGREPGPQRAMFEAGHLLIILHQIPQPDEHQRRAALFWRNAEGEWKTNLKGNGLTALADHLRLFDEKLAALENAENLAVTATEYHTVLEQIAPVLRTSRGLHRALQQAREMLKSERELINLRDQSAGIERNAELLLQDAQFGLNFTVARQAEAQAAAAHRLNLLAALFLPLTHGTDKPVRHGDPEWHEGRARRFLDGLPVRRADGTAGDGFVEEKAAFLRPHDWIFG